jgi:hypothetical protein
MEWATEFMGFLEKIFPAATISKAFQRSFIVAGSVLIWLVVDMVVRRPAGSWLYYRLAAGHRVHDAARLADRVAQLEGEATGLQLSLEMALKELQIRSEGGFTPPPSVAVSSVGVSVTPSPSLPPPAPPATAMGSSLPSSTAEIGPPPPPPPMIG